MAQPTDPITDELERVADELDLLIARRRLGPRTPAQHHDDEETAQIMAGRLVAPFRGSARPVAEPIYHRDNKAAW
ncbi:hypothetical protein CA235_09610 [Sphingomonas sp. ABOLF]|uniref:hypothetical protein n=1 Tax=Sphingomonas sp. ABOLF TaxID=1985879 RepID=UPI000F7F40B7|nr:hypothetical protein [Sphingomonas sp. ABOLF]RSV15182.1 hypothetical protein CA235_09610 [Sphingomonas sp. ABOLF]